MVVADRLVEMGSQTVLIKGVDVNGATYSVPGGEICGTIVRNDILIMPRHHSLGLSSLVVGENTPLTSSLTLVQPGGGSFFAAAQAAKDARASPPVTTATFV